MTTAPSPERSFDTVARMLTVRIGHQLDATRRSRLSRASAEEAARLGLALHDYVAVLARDPDVLQSLLNRITVQETAFFRDVNQFDALARHVLPGLARPVTIWSAGCSNGQEPYSVAMVLAEAGDRTSRVIATDISTKALDRARRGRYSAREVADLGTRRERFLRPDGAEFQIAPDVRARVDFSAHNLFGDPPPFARGACAIVLCRNVLIYFGADAVRAFIERVADWLPPEGWLFLGYSESLWQVTDRFQLVRIGDAFVYRKGDAGSASAPTKRRRTPGERAAGVGDRPPKARVPRPARVLVADAVVSTALPAGTADDPAAAVVAFRKVVYMHPDQPIAYLHLGLALEASGDARAAYRAYAASRAALARGDAASIEAELEGYSVEEFSVLLDAKMVVRS